jgi:hypothetical protein
MWWEVGHYGIGKSEHRDHNNYPAGRFHNWNDDGSLVVSTSFLRSNDQVGYIQ